jgi:hypothetical protein
LSDAGEPCEWGLTVPAGWLMMKRLMKEQQIALTAANCRAI